MCLSMLFHRDVEVKISMQFGEPYFGELSAFLKTSFDARFIGEHAIAFDLACFDFEINGVKLAVISEGMEGTSLRGPQELVRQIVAEARRVASKLVE